MNRALKIAGFVVAIALATQLTGEPGERSIYQLDSSWVADDGRDGECFEP